MFRSSELVYALFAKFSDCVDKTRVRDTTRAIRKFKLATLAKNPSFFVVTPQLKLITIQKTSIAREKQYILPAAVVVEMQNVCHLPQTAPNYHLTDNKNTRGFKVIGSLCHDGIPRFFSFYIISFTYPG